MVQFGYVAFVLQVFVNVCGFTRLKSNFKTANSIYRFNWLENNFVFAQKFRLNAGKNRKNGR